MKRTMKVMLAGLLTAVSTQVFAATMYTNEVNGIKWVYTLSGGKATLGGGSSSTPAIVGNSSGKVEVPSAFGETQVVAIASYAFNGKTGIKNLSVPNSVTNIGNYAFQNCSGATNIVISKGVQYVGYGAFGGCASLESLTIPFVGSQRGNANGSGDNFGYIFGSYSSSGSQNVRQNYYYNNGNNSSYSNYYIPTNLTFVVITDETLLRPYAFQNCTMLTNIVVNGEVSSIGSYAFSGCTGLRSFNIPLSATSIGAYAFSGCSSLSFASMSSSVQWIGSYAFQNCSRLCEITLPEGVRRVYDYAFSGCSSATSVTIPNTTTNIGQYAFQNCSSLTTVEVPKSVENIGYNAFGGCYRLSSMTLPFVGSQRGNANGQGDNFGYVFGSSSSTGSTSIRQNYYYNNGNNSSYSTYYLPTSLTSVVVTDETLLRPYAFQNCAMLTNIVVNDEITSVGSYAFSGCTSLSVMLIPKSLKWIGSYAFQNCSCLDKIDLPEGVNRIYDYAFSGCSLATTVVVPNTVTNIGQYAFQNCSSLAAVEIPKSVESIGYNAFGGCCRLSSMTLPFVGAQRGNANGYGDNFGYVFGSSSSSGSVSVRQNYYYNNGNSSSYSNYYIPTNLTSVVITDETLLRPYAFQNCTMLTNIVMNSTVSSIGSYAFSGCTGLRSFVIPEDATAVGNYAFSGCSMLTELVVPANVRSIGSYAFQNCANLASIRILSDYVAIDQYAFYGCPASIFDTTSVSGLKLMDGYVVGAESTLSGVVDLSETRGVMANAFSGNTKITRVVLPDGMTLIPANAFSSCSSLASITIPDTVKTIGSSAFSGCSSLTSITLPGAVTSIGDYAFNGCRNITSIILPENVQSIGYCAFASCTSLRSVTIPTTLKTIGTSAFSGDSNLATVNIKDLTAWCKIVFADVYSNPVFYSHALTLNGEVIHDLAIPDGLSRLQDYAFYNNYALTSVAVPDGIPEIPHSVFYRCGGITNAVLPESVANIGPYAFQGCTNLTAFPFPMTVTNIADYAFAECSGLAALELPANLLRIGNYSFQKCYGISEVEIPQSVVSIGQYAFNTCTNLANVTVHNGLTSIGNGAFSGCARLTVSLADDVETVPSNLFRYCGGIYDVAFPESVTNIASSAFYGCSLITRLNLPDSLKRIADYAFYGCTALDEVVIPEGVTSIGQCAFGNCTKLTRAVIPSTVKSVGQYAFSGCSQLASVDLAEGAASVGDYAFLNCTSLTNAVIPDTVKTVGESAFDGCTGLTSVSLPDGLITIGNYAFRNCRSLTALDIPSSVRKIGEYAFESCNGLQNLSIPDGVATIGNHAFYACTNLLTLAVPASATNIGWYAFAACSNLTQVMLLTTPSRVIPTADLSLEDFDWSLVDGDTIRADSKKLYSQMTQEAKGQGVLSFEWRTPGHWYRSSYDNKDYFSPYGYFYLSVDHWYSEYSSGSYYSDSCGSETWSPVAISTSSNSRHILDWYYEWERYSVAEGTVDPAKDFGCIRSLSFVPTRIANGDRVDGTVVGASAFEGCVNLERVDVEDVGAWCGTIFENAWANPLHYTGKLFVDGEEVCNLVIPDTVKAVSGWAFADCGGITNIVFPDGITSIGTHAFQNTAIREVALPTSVTNVGTFAFSGCDGVKSISIPVGLRTINDFAFSGQTKVMSATLPSGTALSKFLLDSLKTIRTITIADGETEIVDDAFAGCTALESIHIPDTVQKIGQYAFWRCANLTTIEIPSSASVVWYNAFDGCRKLREIVTDGGNTSYSSEDGVLFDERGPARQLTRCPEALPTKDYSISDGVERVGGYSFQDCADIENVAIPTSVTNIGTRAFRNCSSLMAFEVAEGNPVYTSVDGVLFTKDGKKLLRFPPAKSGHYVIPDGVESIATYAFDGCGRLSSLSFGADVKYVESHAFDGCSFLAQAVLDDGLKSIGDYAFNGCTSLAALTIPESVTSLGEGAFDGCDQLESLSVPENITIKPKELGGRIRGNVSLYRGCIYNVTEDLVILGGATLKIPAGVVLKMGTWCSINVLKGGRLVVSGTRAAPVVITSSMDDEFGGDTNGDGSASSPQGGDWGSIRIQGDAEFSYARIRYGQPSYGPGVVSVSDYQYYDYYYWGDDALWTDFAHYYDDDARLMMDGCVVEHATGDWCVGLSNEGGSVVARNCVFFDLPSGVYGCGQYDEARSGYYTSYYTMYGQTNHFANCVFHGCNNIAMEDWCNVDSTAAVFDNCVFSEMVEWVGGYGESIPSDISFRNCCFWNPEDDEFYPIQTNALIGVAGNVWGNPRFENANAGDFHIKAGSACIDAGREESAPARDYFGQPRNGTPDIGIHEIQVRPVNDADLAALAISGDAEASIGGTINVMWTVGNVGTTIVDEWRDIVELVDSVGHAVELGRRTVVGGLVAGANLSFSATYAVPSMSPGTARLRLKVNPNRDIYEGTLTANNICLSEATVEIVLPAYDSVVNSSFELRAGGSVALRVPAGSGTTAFKLTGSGSASISAYALAGGVPAGLRYDVAAVPLADGSILLVLPKNAAQTDYNIAVFNDGTSSATVSMESVTESVSVLEVAPARLANTGEGHLTIIGTGMDRVSAVRLEGASVIASTKFRADSSANLSATFDLSGATVGSYAVVLVDEDGETYRAGKSVEVYNPKIGPKLEAWLELPSSTRQGRVYTGYIAYANVGDEDMNAPYFKLSAVEATLSLDGSMFKGKPLHVMGISPVSPVGVLATGTEGKIAFFFKSGSRPRFHLDVESDPSSEWNATSAKLAVAATMLNERGRYVVNATTISSFAMNCETNAAHYAISGRFAFANGENPEGVIVFAEDAAGNMVSIDEVDANGVFILGGLSATSNYVVTAEKKAYSTRVAVSIPENSDVAGVVLQGVKPQVVSIVVEGVDEEHLMGAAAYLTAMTGDTLDTGSMWEDGVCTLTTTNTGWLKAEVILPSGMRLSRSFSLEESDNEVDLRFDFSVAASCSGIVTDMDGNVLSNAYVSASYVDGSVVQTLVTDENGAYRILGLNPGHYVLNAAKDGYSSDNVSFEYDGTTPIAAATLRLSQMMGGITGACPGSLAGSIVCVSKSDGSFYRLVYPDENGVFSLSVAQGMYDIYCVDQNGVLLSEVSRVGVTDTIASVTMQEATTFAVKCTLVNSEGAALQGSVRIRGERGISKKSTTGETGLAEFNVAAGGYWITASADGYPEQSCHVTLDRASAVSIRLRQGGFIAGLLDEEFDATSVDIFRDGELAAIVTIEEDGSFASSALPVGSYYVCAMTTNGLLYAENVEVTANATNTVAWNIGNRNVVISLEGSDAAKQSVSYLAETDMAHPDEENCLFREEDGTFRLVNVLSCSRTISAYSRSDAVLGSVIIDGNAESIVLAVSNLTSFKGIVTTIDGTPLLAQLRFYNPDSGSSANVRTSVSGKFTTEVVPSDYSMVCVTSMDGKMWTFSRSEIEAMHNRIVCDESMLKKCTIRVLDNADVKKPVWGIVVQLTDSQGNEVSDVTDFNGSCAFALASGTYKFDIYQNGNLLYRNGTFVVSVDTTKDFYVADELNTDFADVTVSAKRASRMRLMGTMPDAERIDYLILNDRDKRYNDMWQAAHETYLLSPPPCKCGYDCPCNRKINEAWREAYKDYIRKERNAYWSLRSLRETGRERRWQTADELLGYVPVFGDGYGIMRFVQQFPELYDAVKELLKDAEFQDILKNMARDSLEWENEAKDMVGAFMSEKSIIDSWIDKEVGELGDINLRNRIKEYDLEITLNDIKTGSAERKIEQFDNAIAELEDVIQKQRMAESTAPGFTGESARLRQLQSSLDDLKTRHAAAKKSLSRLSTKRTGLGLRKLAARSERVLRDAKIKNVNPRALLRELLPALINGGFFAYDMLRDDDDSWFGRHRLQYEDEFNYEENEEKELKAAFNRLRDAYYGGDYVNGVWQSVCECDGPEFEVETETVEETELNTPVACDPNEIVGPLGVGDPVTERFLKPGEEVAYTIYFENKSDAETAAQEIRVTGTLDPALDWSTFRLGEIAFNNQIDNNLSGYQSGTSEVKMNGTNYYVRTEASCDPATGKVSWYLRIVDKTTADEWPTDLHAGILPPNDDTFRGEGHITYRVNVRKDATPGSLINASASIIFDYNDPIVTDPPWTNKVAIYHTPKLDLGDDGTTNLLLIAGRTFGELPTPPERKNWTFDGWYTGPDGTGIKATPDAIVPDGDFELYQNWLVDGGIAKFEECEVLTEEGSNAVVRVYGGNAESASSVKVYLTCNTAAAADVDLKTASVGSYPSGLAATSPVSGEEFVVSATNLKFPLTLSWAKGEIGAKTVTIPVKTDKTVEGDEFFTLQLAAPNGLTVGEANVCTVTILDANDKTLKTTVTPYKPKKGEAVSTNSVTVTAGNEKGGFVSGTGEYTAGSKLTLTAEQRPGWSFVGWRLKDSDGALLSEKTKWQIVVTNDAEYEAVFEQIPYVRGLADPADGGKVSGSGLCAAGKKVTLKASANKNFTFLGWCQGTGNGGQGTGNGYVATTPSLVIDRSAKPAKDSKTSTTLTNVAEDVTYFAVFKSDPEIFVTVDATDGIGAEPTGKGAGKYVAGTITGMGKYAPGKKVTLKAAANKGYVFAGWGETGNREEGIGNSSADGLLSQAASITFTMPSNDVEYVAKFVTADEDKAAITLELAMGAEAEAFGLSTNEIVSVTNFCGVAMKWPVASGGLSETKVKVSGLPAGLKFTDKPVTSKVGSGKTAVTVTNVPANTIYGAPTAASKTDKNGNVTPSKVVFTVTTAGKSTQTFAINLYIDPLPAWAVGTFKGTLYGGAEESAVSKGTITLSIGKTGKISGKFVDLKKRAYPFTATAFTTYGEDGVLRAKATMKYGETSVAVEIAVGQDGETSVGFAEVGSTSAPFSGVAAQLTK